MKMKLMKSVLYAGLLLMAGAWTVAANAQSRILYGTTALHSVHYTYAVAAAKAVNEIAGDKVRLTVMSTGGAVDNLARLARHQINMGLGTYATVYQAYKGLVKYKGHAMPDLRALWVHAVSLQAWVVRKDSGIKTLQELDGKTFTPGQRGSATEQMGIQILAALGIKPDYYRASLQDAVAAVKNGRSVGYVKAGGMHSLDGTTLSLQAFTPIRLLSFAPDQVSVVKKKFPFINFNTYPANSIQKDIPETTMPIQVIGEFTTKGALTDAQIKAILGAIFSKKGKEIQVAAFPTFGQFDALEASGTLPTIPLAAAAVEFYREHGVKVPDRLVPPEMK